MNVVVPDRRVSAFTEAERDSMSAAFKRASEHHGHYESLFAVVVAWLREAAAPPAPGAAVDRAGPRPSTSPCKCLPHVCMAETLSKAEHCKVAASPSPAPALAGEPYKDAFDKCYRAIVRIRNACKVGRGQFYDQFLRGDEAAVAIRSIYALAVTAHDETKATRQQVVSLSAPSQGLEHEPHLARKLRGLAANIRHTYRADHIDQQTCETAAAELTRLSAEVERLTGEVASRDRRILSLTGELEHALEACDKAALTTERDKLQSRFDYIAANTPDSWGHCTTEKELCEHAHWLDSEIDRLNAACAFKDETNRALQAAYKGQGALESSLTAARAQLETRPAFKVEVSTMVESHQTTYWVVLTRDGGSDSITASPEDGRITPFKSTVREHAEHEAQEWAAFLGVVATLAPKDGAAE